MITGYYKSKEVWVDGESLYPISGPKYINHQPVFSWGISSSTNVAGEWKLAEAILANFLKQHSPRAYRNLARKYQYKFRDGIIAPLRVDDFNMCNFIVEDWIIDSIKELKRNKYWVNLAKNRRKS